jgi:hypothetical protein
MANANTFSEINKSFLFFLILTIVTSILAYNIVNKGYDTVFATYSEEMVN